MKNKKTKKVVNEKAPQKRSVWKWVLGIFLAIPTFFLLERTYEYTQCPEDDCHIFGLVEGCFNNCDYCSNWWVKCDNNLDYKPIIYLYPEEITNVTVALGYPENTTHTYPKYNEPWKVQAEPNGDLIDLKTGRHYYALYWEGKNIVSAPDITEGFVVAGKDTISFLEEKLEQLGLTEREAEEFIVYWLPKLESAPYNLIRFQTLAEQNKNMSLNITPAPQTVIRVMMEYRPLDKEIEIKEQKLPSKLERVGFTVVEWGGTNLKGEIR